MKKFKLWVAVDEDGAVYVYVHDKPEYHLHLSQWHNRDFSYIRVGTDTELKAGAEAIKEIEFELPTKGEEECFTTTSNDYEKV